jgi:hypothetical protein
MSKTRNTRPLELQWSDPTREGELSHYHPNGKPCDYNPENNLFNYRLSHRSSQATLGEERRCVRVTHAYGGKWSLGGNKKKERQLRRRKFRRRENRATQKVLFGYEDDFDLPGRRYDHKTIYFDLT